MDSPRNSLGPGAEIAGYRVQSLIARGSRGVVYRALDVAHDRPVALRLLAPELSADHEFARRFERESRLVASMDHPNILPVYGTGEWSGLLYVAMHHVRGTDLRSELDRCGPLPLPEALRILTGTAAALDAAHAAGVVHGDVRPGNILLSDDPLAADGADGHRRVYLAGFGLGRSMATVTGATTPAQDPGLVDYLAPEQIRGEDVDGRADVYALACVAFALLAGHPPFDEADEEADEETRLRAHLAGEPPRLAGERPDVPAVVESAILRGMARDRADRPPSCGALVGLMSGAPATDVGHVRPRPPDAPTEPAGDGPARGGDDDVRAEPGRPADTGGGPGPGPRPDQHGGSRHRAVPRVGGRARWMIVLGAVLLLLLGLGLVLARWSPGERYVPFRADGVPYTLDVPENWTARTHQAGDSTVSVLSPADLTAFFADDPEAPAAVGRTAADDPSDVVGLAIYHRPTGLEGQSPAARVDAAEALLPGRDAYLVHRGEATVGDLTGQVMEGSVQLPTATLQVRALVVETDPTQLLVFFAPSSLFHERAEVFDEVTASLRRTG
ncbi:MULTISPECIES: serine/threonine-protein kinase [Citricoccus]|uniref:serine/threonine-protein kinase n=1 Tax=Citricoccus TaxID=169133 RepID=UPI000255DE34|nr:serine/threonine-protein kinase [Citricoccus sp. CH26A]